MNLEVLTTDHPDLDILCVTEHWLKEDDFEYYNLKDFSPISKFCRKNKKHGGSCIFVKSSLKAKSYTKFESICMEDHFEASMVELDHLKTIVICIYRTPNSNILVFIEILDNVLNELTKKQKKVILIGDFNINFLDDKVNTQLLSVLNSYGLQTVIDEPTRVGKDSQSAIDQIILNTSLWDYNHTVIDTGFSDLYAQILQLNNGSFHVK